MNLNRKGYLTVEVILASVLAITIAIFLMEITIKLVNVTDDAYVDTELLTDKALIIKNIKKLIEEDNNDENRGIDQIQCLNNRCDLTYCDTKRRYIEINDGKIIYGDAVNNTTIYSKNISDKINDIALTSSVNGNVLEDDGYIMFKLFGNNKFLKDNFNVNIIVHNEKDC